MHLLCESKCTVAQGRRCFGVIGMGRGAVAALATACCGGHACHGVLPLQSTMTAWQWCLRYRAGDSRSETLDPDDKTSPFLLVQLLPPSSLFLRQLERRRCVPQLPFPAFTISRACIGLHHHQRSRQTTFFWRQLQDLRECRVISTSRKIFDDSSGKAAGAFQTTG